MLLGLDEPDELPPLAPVAFWSLIALLLVIWVLLRVRLAQRQIERHGEASTRLGFVQRLAQQPGISWILGGVALALAVVVILFR
jgi:hypothetical protein